MGQALEVIPKKIACKHFELEEVLLPLLLGRVFHVTTEATFDRICQLGRIYSNQEVEFALTLGHSKNCYGRKRGWVSLFDLSHTADAHNENTHVYLFMAESAWPSLISWKRASREVGATEVFIPFVEAWYPGDIPIELVSDSLMVTVDPG